MLGANFEYPNNLEPRRSRAATNAVDVTDIPTTPDSLLAETDWLRRLARELVGDSHAAEDLAQETVLAALTAKSPDHAGIRTWLRGIARNLAAFRYRSEYRRQHHERGAAVSAPPPVAPAAADLCAQFALHSSVVDTVMGLDRKVREALLMRFWGDQSAREISSQLGVPVETVRTRIKRGLAQMRGRLDAEHGDRRAWVVPLLGMHPFAPAVVSQAVVSQAGVVTSSPLWFGVLAMSMKTKLVAITVTLALGALYGAGVLSPAVAGLDPEHEVKEAAREVTGPVAQLPEVQLDRAPVDAGAPPSKTVIRGAVHGRVTDAAGNPIADVEICQIQDTYVENLQNADDTTGRLGEPSRVRMFDALTFSSANGGLDQDTVFQGWVAGDYRHTDAKGQFDFADRLTGSSYVGAWHREFGVRIQETPKSGEAIVFEFEAWPRITGLVTGKDKLPLAGVTVDVRTKAILNQSMGFKTDTDGRFRSLPIPPGEYRLAFQVAGYRWMTKPLGQVSVDRSVEVELNALTALKLQLVDENDQSWTAKRLTDRGWDAEQLQFNITSRATFESWQDLAHTGEAISLDFDGEHGTLAGNLKYPERQRYLSLWQGKHCIAGVELESYTAKRLRLRIPRPVPDTSLEVGVSLDRHGSASTEVTVSLYRRVGPMVSFNNKAEASAKRDGPLFTLDVPGDLRGKAAYLVARCVGYAQQVVPLSIPLEGSVPSQHLTLQLADQRLTGRVVDEANKPVQGAQLALSTSDGRFLVADNRRQTSDSDGKFAFEGLARRDVRIFVEMEGFAFHSLVVATDTDAPLTIQLNTRSMRHVRIDLEGAQLRILDHAGAPLFDDRIMDGSVSFGRKMLRLPPSAHRIEVYRPAGITPYATAFCSSAVTGDTIPLELIGR